MKIFISSVQHEFYRERVALAKYIREDALLGDFFEVFLFEEQPARNRTASDVYLGEVEDCDIYLGLFGAKYGSRAHDSVPRNQVIATAMSWTSYVEKTGSGTGEIIEKCTKYGLARPEFDPTVGFFKTVIWRKGHEPGPGDSRGAQEGAHQGAQEGAHQRDVTCGEELPTGKIGAILAMLWDGPMRKEDVASHLKVDRRTRTLKRAFEVLFSDALIEYTIPDNPRHKQQRYQLTAKGRALIAKRCRPKDSNVENIVK